MKVCGKDIQIQGTLLRIARLEADGYDFLEDEVAMLKELRRLDTRIDLFTFMENMAHTSARFNYPMEWDNLAALPVSTFDHWWKQTVNDKTRNMVRKAEKKGVQVREVEFDDTLLQGIWTIYNECPIRQGKPFAHYGKDIERVRREKSTFPERSIFLGAYLEDTLIGFAKLTTDESRTQAGLMQIVAMIQHRDKAPTNALMAQAVRSCAERGIPYLVYSRFSDRKKERDPLSDFKEHNGFQRIDLPRYYVPLTSLGAAAFRLGLHHGLADRLPRPVLDKVRELRNSWYNRKLQQISQGS
jgi:hypothetical protein